MYPIFFSYKFITIGSYGVMLGLGFYLAFLLTEREFKIAGKDPELAYKILLAAIPSAIAGAKIFHILEHLDEFFKDPSGMIFSGAGLSAYGGYIFAFIFSIILIRMNKESILEIFDLTAPAMAIGYAVGRIGCHVSGDGCYGKTTDSIIGMAYPNGIVPSSAEVYPTPLFESFYAFLLFALLMQLRKKGFRSGTVFFAYLVINGIGRFAVEFIRVNPEILFGFTQAQLVAIVFSATGLIGLLMVNRKNSHASL